MENTPATLGRRTFLKTTTLAGGGLMLGFGWLAEACKTPDAASPLPGAPTDWVGINGYIKIAPDGRVTIMSPNPEIGQNVKTTMPMIVADELDVAWEQVTVEQAGLNTEIFKRQLAGGSQSIRQGWEPLRTAGATARHMLRQAAAQTWNVPADEVSTSAGRLYHKPSGRSAGYGDMATAASKVPVPEKVKWKEIKDFTIIGTPRRNVDAPKIVSGQTLYGM
ncbi:MAG TPA: molybdopterin-dependent oxidoreductase, partial [Saprospiraceae bacterium]|nr:molybdopterin-dependent oxidoreductase [Saprospiraceae bacterium]